MPSFAMFDGEAYRNEPTRLQRMYYGCAARSHKEKTGEDLPPLTRTVYKKYYETVENFTPLMKAIRQRNYEEAKNLITDQSASEPSDDNYYPIFLVIDITALSPGDTTKLLNKLVKHRAALDQRFERPGLSGMMTPLMYSAIEKNEEALYRLTHLIKSSSPDQLNAQSEGGRYDGWTTLHFIVAHGALNRDPTPLGSVIARDMLNGNLAAGLAFGITPHEVQRQNDDKMLLFRCAKKLIEAGANKSIRNKEGNTAYDLCRDPDIRELLRVDEKAEAELP